MNPKWHTIARDEVLRILGSNEHGLTKKATEERLKEYGPNKLPDAKVDSIVEIFLRQFESPLIYTLMVASLVVFFIGELTDALIIFMVLFFNAVVGTIQEGRAQNTLLALKHFVDTKALVMRDGEELIVPDSQIVPGDIVVLQEGEKIPADARVITARNLRIDEAALTGESEPVQKNTDTLEKADAPVLEQKNMVFKGTHIVAGFGLAVVVDVGTNTVIGKIAREVATIDTEIPLKTNIRHLSRLIVLTTAVVSVILFIVGISTGKSEIEMFATVVSLAVSIIPEGLPIAMTLVLATGVWRMSKRNALIKRLQAVEALGQARVIAVDKTGTITKNEMVIQTIYTAGRIYKVDGVGYEPKGQFSLEGKVIQPLEHSDLLFVGRLAVLATNAHTMFSEESKGWRVAGDPTEAALFVLGEKLGFNKEDLERELEFLKEQPFDYKLKYRVALHKEQDASLKTVVGAPEVILKLCSKIWNGTDARLMYEGEKESLEQRFFEISKQGLRVLALAFKMEEKNADIDHVDSLTFVAFFGMRDALRPEVKDATCRAQEAGMRVVMITGDHKTTAEALAREALIFRDGDRVLTGVEIDEMSDKSLREVLSNTSVFARVTPEHKLRIIKAYKARGEIVAMTGDGVNDAPSLVAADLGVSMGKIGTEVAKEASDIVLLDDNFGSIVSAIEEGRNIYKTIKKVILYLVSTSLGELLVISSAIFLGLPLPLLPAQIIWLNFVTDGFFTAALAMEPKEKNLLKQNFEKSNKYLIDGSMGKRMFLMAAVMMIGTLLLFREYYDYDLAKAWTISLTLLAVFQWFNAWNCRSEKESIFRSNPLSNRFMIGATLGAAAFQIIAVYHPFFQKFLHTVPLDLSEWLVIIILASSILIVEEIRKLLLQWRIRKSSSSSALQLQASQI